MFDFQVKVNDELSDVDLVIGRNDIMEEEIYLNYRKKLIRIAESQNVQYAYKQIPTFSCLKTVECCEYLRYQLLKYLIGVIVSFIFLIYYN